MALSTQEVFQSHLQLRQQKNVEQDLQQNFDPEVLLLTGDGAFSGYDGVRQSSQLLQQRVGDAVYAYLSQITQGEIAFLVWLARQGDEIICQGADSFVIRHGKIVVQTIYYH